MKTMAIPAPGTSASSKYLIDRAITGPRVEVRPPRLTSGKRAVARLIGTMESREMASSGAE
jgi:hypothetical protein